MSAEFVWDEVPRAGMPGQTRILYGKLIGKAAVQVNEYDRGTLRFQVYKLFKIPNGQTRNTAKYYERRHAALAYARRWLEGRAA